MEEVHPRSRGEYILNVVLLKEVTGSPPLTRGIQGYKIYNVRLCRFTPAHAGNTTV